MFPYTQPASSTQLRSSIAAAAATGTSPLLTVGSVDSIFDLHFFFQSLLSSNNSNQAFTGTCLNGNDSQLAYNDNCALYNLSKNNADAMKRPNTIVSNNHATSGKQHHSKKSKQLESDLSKSRHQRKSLTKNRLTPKSETPTALCGAGTNSSNSTSSPNGRGGGGRGNEYISLDELFMNIDQAIANDFIEPLPSNNNNIASS